MANWKTVGADIISAFTSTSGLTATEKKNLRDGMVTQNQGEFAEFLERTGFSDTAGNRSKFFAFKMLRYARQESTAGNRKLNTQNALADPSYQFTPMADVEDPD
jgi:hypothetical protein